ncbi:hypothetical protein HDU88_007871 [Geranomyces variabilis]|nr:hypothetical protein HDU88_007871 [Geranomyces variabilis]
MPKNSHSTSLPVGDSTVSGKDRTLNDYFSSVTSDELAAAYASQSHGIRRPQFGIPQPRLRLTSKNRRQRRSLSWSRCCNPLPMQLLCRNSLCLVPEVKKKRKSKEKQKEQEQMQQQQQRRLQSFLSAPADDVDATLDFSRSFGADAHYAVPQLLGISSVSLGAAAPSTAADQKQKPKRKWRSKQQKRLEQEQQDTPSEADSDDAPSELVSAVRDLDGLVLANEAQNLFVDATRALAIAEASQGTETTLAEEEVRKAQELVESLGGRLDDGAEPRSIPFTRMGIRFEDYEGFLADHPNQDMSKADLEDADDTDFQAALSKSTAISTCVTDMASEYQSIGTQLAREKGGWGRFRELTDAAGLPPTIEQQQYAADLTGFLATRGREIQLLLQDNCGGRKDATDPFSSQTSAFIYCKLLGISLFEECREQGILLEDLQKLEDKCLRMIGYAVLNRQAQLYRRWTSTEVVNFSHRESVCPPVPPVQVAEGRFINQAQNIATRNQTGSAATTLVACGSAASFCAKGTYVARRKRLMEQNISGIKKASPNLGLPPSTRVFVLAHPSYVMQWQDSGLREEELHSTARTLYTAFTGQRLAAEDSLTLSAITSIALTVLLGVNTGSPSPKLALEERKLMLGMEESRACFANRRAQLTEMRQKHVNELIQAGLADTEKEAYRYIMRHATQAQWDGLIAVGLANTVQEAKRYSTAHARDVRDKKIIAAGHAKTKKEANSYIMRHAVHSRAAQIVSDGRAADKQDAFFKITRHANKVRNERMIADGRATSHADADRKSMLHASKLRRVNGTATYEDLVNGFPVQYFPSSLKRIKSTRTQTTLTLRVAPEGVTLSFNFTWKCDLTGDHYRMQFTRNPRGLSLTDAEGKFIGCKSPEQLRKHMVFTKKGTPKSHSPVLADWFDRFIAEQNKPRLGSASK